MRALAVTTLLLLTLPTAAAAQQGPTRVQLRQLLSGIEDGPSDADLRRLGEGALPVLIELYQDEREAPFIRLRAVGASGAFPRPATRTFLLAVARAEGQSDLLAREAVRALARAFGADALGELASFLAHAEALVREAAATALGRLGGAEARAALRARRTVEQDPLVLRAIDAGLARTR